jgi:hypothetical protein
MTKKIFYPEDGQYSLAEKSKIYQISLQTEKEISQYLEGALNRLQQKNSISTGSGGIFNISLHIALRKNIMEKEELRDQLYHHHKKILHADFDIQYSKELPSLHDLCFYLNPEQYFIISLDGAGGFLASPIFGNSFEFHLGPDNRWYDKDDPSKILFKSDYHERDRFKITIHPNEKIVSYEEVKKGWFGFLVSFFRPSTLKRCELFLNQKNDTEPDFPRDVRISTIDSPKLFPRIVRWGILTAAGLQPYHGVPVKGGTLAIEIEVGSFCSGIAAELSLRVDINGKKIAAQAERDIMPKLQKDDDWVQSQFLLVTLELPDLSDFAPDRPHKIRIDFRNKNGDTALLDDEIWIFSGKPRVLLQNPFQKPLMFKEIKNCLIYAGESDGSFLLLKRFSAVLQEDIFARPLFIWTGREIIALNRPEFKTCYLELATQKAPLPLNAEQLSISSSQARSQTKKDGHYLIGVYTAEVGQASCIYEVEFKKTPMVTDYLKYYPTTRTWTKVNEGR